MNEEPKKMSVADKLVNIGMRGVRLFHTPDGTAYGGVHLDNGGRAVYPIDGKDMKSLIIQRYHKETKKVPSSEAVRNAINVLVGTAKHDRGEVKLSNRVAWDGENIIYDMSNALHEHVVITREGWAVAQSDDPIFRRYAHQLPQIKPVSGGKVDDIFEVVNVSKSDRLMTMVHLVSSLIPDIPHPSPNICGEQGAAKSTASKMFKYLIDPSEIETASMPSNEDRMHQMLSHHWYLIFDNVSYIQDWQSDLFCRAITGQASAKRVLYSDDDDLIQRYKMCIGFNGISTLATSGDLLDRSFALRLEPIGDEVRMDENEVWGKFNGMRDELVGAMFDVLVKALEVYPDIKLESMPRMADFAKWGCAISIGLGYTQDDFIKAYYDKISESNMNALESTPVAELIIEFIEWEDGVWEGTARDLWDALLGILAQQGRNKADVVGMKNVVALGRAHDRIAPNLRKIGIDWEKIGRNKRGQIHRIKKHTLKQEMV